MSKKLIYLFVLIIPCLFFGSFLFAQSLDGIALRIGGDDNIGRMSPEGMNNKIIGVVETEGESPDIFMQSDPLYPGIFYYQYLERSEKGVPIFGNRKKVLVPFNESEILNVSIFQKSDKSINMVWLSGNKLHQALFNAVTNKFEETGSSSFPSFGDTPSSMSSFIDANDNLNVIVSITADKTVMPPGDPKSADYVPFWLTGVWRGKMGSEKLYRVMYVSGSNVVKETQLVSASGSEVLMSISGSSSINLKGTEVKEDIIAGSYFGSIYYFKKESDYKKLQIVDREGDFVRNPNMAVAPIAYPSESGELCDILAAGRGSVFFYKYTGDTDDAGRPIYENPELVLQKEAYLYGGTMPAPTVVDVDKDGLLDIVSGNAEGYILLYKNIGSNENPKFAEGEYLKSNDQIIRIEPGYSESPEGPLGARLGYAGPNLIDWDGDGVVDLLVNDSRNKHSYFKGQLKDGKISFMREKPLFHYGLDLRGTWRCRPGVGLLDGKMAYITLDDDDEFHLYWQIDNQNLDDAGKLKMENGATIKANYMYSHWTGRVRFDLVDWDGDGVKDLLLGVDKWHSIPNTTSGLPAKMATPSATVLFMKNGGTEASPLFKQPVPIDFREQSLMLGTNAAGVSACLLGEIEGGEPNVLISDERGRFYLLERGKMNPSCDVPVGLPGNLIEKSLSSLSPNSYSAPSVVNLGNNLYLAYDYGVKTIIRKSDDNGVSWEKIAELNYGKNGALFVINNQLYLMGSSHSSNNCVILKSDDFGVNWTVPTTPANGLLLTSNSSNTVITTSSPALIYNNRVYKSIEQEDSNGKRRIGFMSASVDNMMARTAWTTTNYVEKDNSLSGSGWQDGRLILTAQNEIINIASLKGGNGNASACLNISTDDKTASFDTNRGTLNLPGGSKDFTVKYDNVSGRYWAITNSIKNTDAIGDASPDLVYNNLSLISSSDLKNWTVEKEILHTSDFNSQGFLFTDWVIVGSDIIAVCGVSWDDCEGSVSNLEKPNFIVSFRVNNFRN